MKILALVLVLISFSSFANEIDQKEVVENPTLQTLSGALSSWSLLSTFTYRGGSLEKPFGAERPNIRQREAVPNLADLSGTMGVKYRLSKTDNLSIQMGLYSTTPFHSTIDTNNEQNQRDFDKNHQNLDADDPVLSYFKTYYIGSLQNISFLKYQYVTRESFRDYGLRSAISLSHAAAYRISKSAYIAGSFTYENYAYDSSTINFNGTDVSIKNLQAEHKFRGNLSAEYYMQRNISFRAITDLFSYNQMRTDDTPDIVKLQQTLAMTYFYTRDISIAPNLRFIAEDIRSDRTNLGLTLTVNL